MMMILVHRLDHLFGINGKVIDWLKSYLSTRYQKVVINTNESGALSIKHGVPQGSVLGPILFSLYSQPLTEIINRHSFKYHAYNDDTQISKSVPLKNVPDMLNDLNTCITNVREWMASNKLKMNGDKTEIMLVGTQYKINSISASHVTIIGESIPISSKVINLGVILDNTLSMEQAVSQVRKGCLLELRRIRQIRRFIDEKVTKRLIIAFVISRIDSCNSLFKGASHEKIKRLQEIQNQAAELVKLAHEGDPVTPILKDLHWLPVQSRIDYKIFTLVLASWKIAI